MFCFVVVVFVCYYGFVICCSNGIYDVWVICGYYDVIDVFGCCGNVLDVFDYYLVGDFGERFVWKMG